MPTCSSDNLTNVLPQCAECHAADTEHDTPPRHSIQTRGQARTQGGCPGNHLFVLKYLIWLNEDIILFDISFIKGLVKGRLTNENNKRTIADAEIFDNRNGRQVGYDQALYPRPHDIFDYLCF